MVLKQNLLLSKVLFWCKNVHASFIKTQAYTCSHTHELTLKIDIKIKNNGFQQKTAYEEETGPFNIRGKAILGQPSRCH